MENVSNPDEHKVNGSSKQSSISSSQDYRSDSTSPISAKTGKSVAAELSAKIAAKQNSRLKQQNHSNGGNGGGGQQKPGNKHMEPPRMKVHSQHPQKTSLSPNIHHHQHHHDLPLQYMDSKTSPIKSSFHSFHDVESRLASTKISLSDFKHAKPTAPPVALNLKRNYLWKKPKFQKSKEKKSKRQSNDEKWHDDGNFWNETTEMLENNIIIWSRISLRC